MMRLPKFTYRAPKTAAEGVAILSGEGPSAQVVAGGTDLYPNMKRRQVEPKTVVSLRHVKGLNGVSANGSVRIGANTAAHRSRLAGIAGARYGQSHHDSGRPGRCDCR